jgi:osmotically-inducible protein OsmY
MSIRTTAAALTLFAVLGGLAGCGEREGGGPTVGQRVDSAIERSAEAGREVREGAREATQGANTAVMGAGARIDDAQITTQVKTGLSTDRDLSAGQIDVDTRDGVVTLKGTAPSAAAKARAAEIARNVKDVKSVDNQLQVRAG